MKGGGAMENFMDLNKKRLLSVWFEGAECETHITLFKITQTKEYYIVIQKFVPDLEDKFRKRTAFFHRYKVQEGDLVEEFKKAMQEYVNGETLKFYHIDKSLTNRAKILYTSNSYLFENLEKIRPFLKIKTA